MKDLIGKNILEVIVELSNRKWDYRIDGKTRETKISEFLFVYYQKEKPRSLEDLYHPVRINKNFSLENLSFIEQERERGIGLTSIIGLDSFGKAFLGLSAIKHGISNTSNFHIPFIDIDLDRSDLEYTQKSIDLIKSLIKEYTQINSGLILKSSSKNNLHFIGMGRLLSEEEFITFLGLSLTMGYKKKDGQGYIGIADSRHIGHSLTPMKYLTELNGDGWSKYDNVDRFATLRVNPKTPWEGYSKVVDVLQ